MPKVSVIIPVYNTENYLPQCLDSVSNQTLKDIEIICVNDCSVDNSLQILQEYADKDRRIKIIDFKENRGVSASRNAGIEVADGEYTGFLDSDDYVDLDFFAKLYEKAEQTYADIIKGNLKYIENDKELNDFKNLNDKIRENKYNFNCLFFSAIYKTSFIKNHNILFEPGINNGEDRLFQLTALLHCRNIEIADDVFYYYIRHNNSLTTRANNGFESCKHMILVLTLLLRKINDFNLDKNDYRLLFNEFFIYIIEKMRLNPDITEKLYEEIKTILILADKEKLPQYIDVLYNCAPESLHKNLMLYKSKLLIEKIRSGV